MTDGGWPISYFHRPSVIGHRRSRNDTGRSPRGVERPVSCWLALWFEPDIRREDRSGWGHQDRSVLLRVSPDRPPRDELTYAEVSTLKRADRRPDRIDLPL